MAAWATNWETTEGKGKLLRPALNELRAALSERCTAINRTLPVACPEITAGQIIKKAWFTAFHGEVSTVISRDVLAYANHTVNSGDFEGEENIPPWTEATLLAAIGDEARVPVPNDPAISAEWLYQNKKIINMLKWIRIRAGGSSVENIKSKTATNTGKASLADAISDCRTAYAAASWVDSNTFLGAHTSTHKKGDTNYGASQGNYKADILYGYTASSLHKSVDVYLRAHQKVNNAYSQYGNNAPNFNSTEAVYKKSFTSSENNETTETFAFEQDEPTDFLTPSVLDQAYQNSAYIDTEDLYSNTDIVFILKFDGPNGFEHLN